MFPLNETKRDLAKPVGSDNNAAGLADQQLSPQVSSTVSSKPSQQSVKFSSEVETSVNIEKLGIETKNNTKSDAAPSVRIASKMVDLMVEMAEATEIAAQAKEEDKRKSLLSSVFQQSLSDEDEGTELEVLSQSDSPNSKGTNAGGISQFNSVERLQEYYSKSFKSKSFKSKLKNNSKVRGVRKAAKTLIDLMVQPIHFILIGLSVLGLFICDRYNLSVNVSFSIFAIPLVFPISFSINSSYMIRQHALSQLVEFKTQVQQLYVLHRDLSHTLPSEKDAEVFELRTIYNMKILGFLVTNLLGGGRRHASNMEDVYDVMNDISIQNEYLRTNSKIATVGYVGRIYGYTTAIMKCIESLKYDRLYKSPRSLRIYTKSMVYSMPLFAAPYYSYLGEIYGTWAGYYFAIFITMIFSVLQIVQDEVDDSFDNNGADDIDLNEMNDWFHYSIIAPNAGRDFVTTEMQELFRNSDKVLVFKPYGSSTQFYKIKNKFYKMYRTDMSESHQSNDSMSCRGSTRSNSLIGDNASKFVKKTFSKSKNSKKGGVPLKSDNGYINSFESGEISVRSQTTPSIHSKEKVN